MKCVAFNAEGENRMPLLATMPISYPWIFANPYMKPVLIIIDCNVIHDKEDAQ
jgi:hypothetical protein